MVEGRSLKSRRTPEKISAETPACRRINEVAESKGEDTVAHTSGRLYASSGPVVMATVLRLYLEWWKPLRSAGMRQSCLTPAAAALQSVKVHPFISDTFFQRKVRVAGFTGTDHSCCRLNGRGGGVLEDERL